MKLHFLNILAHLVEKKIELFIHHRNSLFQSLDLMSMMFSVDHTLSAYRWTMTAETKVAHVLIRMIYAWNALESCVLGNATVH